MNNNITELLSKHLPIDLVNGIVNSFHTITHDFMSGQTEGISPGKFVEITIQILQYLENGSYDESPKVDAFLQSLESRQSTLNDDLKLCLSRIARSMYTLRNRRNIAHTSSFDPSLYDLKYLVNSAQWVMSELIRNITNMPMDQAGHLIEYFQSEIHPLIENVSGKKIVHANVNAKEEICLILKNLYPSQRSTKDILKDLDRRKESTVRGALNVLWSNKLIEGNSKDGFKLTSQGLRHINSIQKNLFTQHLADGINV